MSERSVIVPVDVFNDGLPDGNGHFYFLLYQYAGNQSRWSVMRDSEIIDSFSDYDIAREKINHIAVPRSIKKKAA